MRNMPVRSSTFKLRGAMALLAATLLSACAANQVETAATPTVPETEAALVERARDIHRQSLVLDAHADIVLPSTSKTYLGADGLSKVAPAKLRAGGIGAVVMSVAVGPGSRTKEGRMLARAEADEKLAAVSYLIEQDQNLALALSPTDVEKLHAGGKTAMLLGFQNARALNGQVDALDQFYAAGVRIFGLNHLGHNDFSDSSRPLYIAETRSYEPTAHGGLSQLGAAAIQRINALGGIIDVSQMSKSATIQAVKLSRSPVIASHSNARKLSDVSRNLSDEEIDLIAKAGGVIHLAAFGAYLVDLSDTELLGSILKVRRDAGLPDAYSYPYELYWEIPDLDKRQAFLRAMRNVIGPGSVDRLVDHIDYIVSRVGIDHVGIGSDFNHGGGVAGFVDASEAPNVTLALVRRGYSANQIKKIWGENFLRVFRVAQNAADETN